MNRLLVFSVILFAGLQNLFGHKIHAVEFDFRATPQMWTLSGTMDVTYLLPEFRKEDENPPLTGYTLMEKTSPEKWQIYLDEIEDTLRQIISFRFDDKVIPYKINFPGHSAASPELLDFGGNTVFTFVELLLIPMEGKGELRAHWNDDMNADLIVVVEPEKNAEIYSAPSGESIPLLSQDSDRGVLTPAGNSIWSWLKSGFQHVIPLGPDHILFILGIILAATRLRPLLGQSLLFTLAHSITLICAVIGWINFPTTYIEILIAFSIAWIGLENLWLKKMGRGRIALIFAFGVIHGLGFASNFADLSGNIPRDARIIPLIGFNLGVEIAQTTLLIVAWVLLRPFGTHERRVRLIGSLLITAAGIFWMIERIGTLT